MDRVIVSDDDDDNDDDDNDNSDDANPISRLTSIAEAKAALAREESAAVRHARMHGMSWAEIGLVLGVSKQALHKRFGRVG